MRHKKKEKKIKPYKKRKVKKEENLFDNQGDLISLLAPEVIEEKRDYIYLGSNKYSRIFALIFYPNKIWLGWIDEILNEIGDVDISIQVQVADERNVEKYLTHKITKLRSDKYLFIKQGNIENLHKLEEQIQALEEMRKDIHSNLTLFQEQKACKAVVDNFVGFLISTEKCVPKLFFCFS